MLYMIYGEDVPDSAARRAAARPAHLARIQEVIDSGRLILPVRCPRSTAQIRARPE